LASACQDDDSGEGELDAVRLFWAAHENHHSSEYFNLSTALRQSWTTPFTVPFFYISLPLLGFSPAMIATQISVSLIYQFWIHTELIDRLPRWFEAVFNTPSHHRSTTARTSSTSTATTAGSWAHEEHRQVLAAPNRVPRVDRDDRRGAPAGAARDAACLRVRATGLERGRLDAHGFTAPSAGATASKGPKGKRALTRPLLFVPSGSAR